MLLYVISLAWRLPSLSVSHSVSVHSTDDPPEYLRVIPEQANEFYVSKYLCLDLNMIFIVSFPHKGLDKNLFWSLEQIEMMIYRKQILILRNEKISAVTAKLKILRYLILNNIINFFMGHSNNMWHFFWHIPSPVWLFNYLFLSLICLKLTNNALEREYFYRLNLAVTQNFSLPKAHFFTL